MKLYKYKIFNIILSVYEELDGVNTWFSELEVTKAYEAMKGYAYLEVHKIYLTTVCVLE